MSRKVKLLDKLTKPQLLKIAEAKGINIPKSRSKLEIIEAVAKKLRLEEIEKLVEKYEVIEEKLRLRRRLSVK